MAQLGGAVGVCEGGRLVSRGGTCATGEMMGSYGGDGRMEGWVGVGGQGRVRVGGGAATADATAADREVGTGDDRVLGQQGGN